MTRDKEITLAYQKGFKSGARIKYGKYSFEQILHDSQRFRREYNRRIKIAKMEAIEEFKTQSHGGKS